MKKRKSKSTLGMSTVSTVVALSVGALVIGAVVLNSVKGQPASEKQKTTTVAAKNIKSVAAEIGVLDELIPLHAGSAIHAGLVWKAEAETPKLL